MISQNVCDIGAWGGGGGAEERVRDSEDSEGGAASEIEGDSGGEEEVCEVG